jgi:chromate transporter
MIATLGQLLGLFALLSVLAVGGGAGIIPAMQHAAVNVHQWMTNRQFLDVFAISRAAPGPGSLIAVLVGLKAAGLAGALVAGFAMYTPSCMMVHAAARVWRRYEHASWRQTVERGLAPVAVGLTYASSFALLRGTEHTLLALGSTVVATIVLVMTEINPLIILAASGAFALAVSL